MENIVLLSLRALGRETPTGWLRSLLVHVEDGVRRWLHDGRPAPVPGSVSDHPRLVKARLESLLERLAGHEQTTVEHSSARRLLEGCLLDLHANEALVAVLFPDPERAVTMLYPWHPPWEAFPEAWVTTSERTTLALHLAFLDAVTGMMTCRENVLDPEKTRVVTRSFENLLVRVAAHHGTTGFTAREALLARHEAICLLLRAARERDAAGAAPKDAARDGGASPPGTETR